MVPRAFKSWLYDGQWWIYGRDLRLTGKCAEILYFGKTGAPFSPQGLDSLLMAGVHFIISLFTSFSRHRPAHRKCAQMGLTGRSHATCHPYPIPQPIKVGHTSGVYNPYSFQIVCSFMSHKNKSSKVLWDGTYGFLSRLESLTICRCH